MSTLEVDSIAGKTSPTVVDLPSGTTLDGAASNAANGLVQLDGSGALPAVDGSALTGVGGGGAWTLISSTSISTTSSVTVTGLDDTTYATYVLVLSGVTGDSASEPRLRFGDSSGIDSGASDYIYHIQDSQAGVSTYGGENSTSANALQLGTFDFQNKKLSAVVYIDGPAASQTTIHGTWVMEDNSAMVGGVLMGARKSNITFDRLQVFPTAGNLGVGRISVYGISYS